MELYLLRHGQSEGNKKGLFQGSLDFPLSEEGKNQVLQMANFLKTQSAKRDLIISSPQKRALESAQILQKVLGVPLEIDERIKEISYGVLEGKTLQEVENWKSYQLWLENPVANPLEGVEDFASIENRLGDFLKSLSSKEGERFLIVTHGGIIRALTCMVTDIGFSKMWKFSVANASLSVLKIDPKTFKGKIKFFNFHLQAF
ncbi:MAG: histidine phosphatase family protein [Aquificae bacterium]|nr:histidine phosphatase family protein [Aquificota bacterium]